MLSKQQRLNSALCDVLRKKGKRASNTLFSMSFLPNITSRGAVVIPKKVYKKANERVRARRRILAILRVNEFWGIKADFLIQLRSPIDTISYIELSKCLESLLKS